jgi:hypothetical protein
MRYNPEPINPEAGKLTIGIKLQFEPDMGLEIQQRLYHAAKAFYSDKQQYGGIVVVADINAMNKHSIGELTNRPWIKLGSHSLLVPDRRIRLGALNLSYSKSSGTPRPVKGVDYAASRLFAFEPTAGYEAFCLFWDSARPPLPTIYTDNRKPEKREETISRRMHERNIFLDDYLQL